MAKKANPWVAALKKKKAPVDLHPDVLRAVLKMNPDMRGGDRSTEDVASAMMKEIPQKQAAAAGFSDGKFKNVFSDMLADFDLSLQEEMKGIEKRRQALDAEAAKMRESYIDRVVEFLVEVAPGPLGENSREVLRKHSELMRKLQVETSELGRIVRQRSESYQR